MTEGTPVTHHHGNRRRAPDTGRILRIVGNSALVRWDDPRRYDDTVIPLHQLTRR